MKIKQRQELKKNSLTELKSLLTEEKEKLFKIKLDIGLKKVKNVHSLKAKRKEIAIIKTIMAEKKIMEGVK